MDDCDSDTDVALMEYGTGIVHIIILAVDLGSKWLIFLTEGIHLIS